MDKEQELKIVKDMQAVVAQMRVADIEDNPDSEFEELTCDCCGEEKTFAGSVVYGDKVLCNDCVLFAEIAFALKKINSIDELVASMEDKRLQDMCEFLIEEQMRLNN